MKACFYFNDELLSEENIKENENNISLTVPKNADRLILCLDKKPCIVSASIIRDKKGENLYFSHNGKEIDGSLIYFSKEDGALLIPEIKKDTEEIEISLHIDTLYGGHGDTIERLYKSMKKKEKELESDYLTAKRERDAAVFAYDRAIAELYVYKNRPFEKIKRKIKRKLGR